ncbi:ashwin isoform X2 [Vicugna pacos]|uniref:Ashwin n=1 Tax=Vicugna pacos TaxID=30538 RepID=A0ABM5CF97_VICPA
MAGDVAGRGCADSELLLHPELLSQEFLLLTLEQKNIAVENDVRVNKDSLTDLYVQHAIPLPRRDLPKNRWGKMMEKKREQHEIKNETKSFRSGTVDGLRKRALVVLEGSSTSASIKEKSSGAREVATFVARWNDPGEVKASSCPSGGCRGRE